MFTNRFDELIDEVSGKYELNWDGASQACLFARFLDQRKNANRLYIEFKRFLETEAEEEASYGGEDEEDVKDAE